MRDVCLDKEHGAALQENLNGCRVKVRDLVRPSDQPPCSLFTNVVLIVFDRDGQTVQWTRGLVAVGFEGLVELGSAGIGFVEKDLGEDVGDLVSESGAVAHGL